jgi:outer membrane biosynthesis protein TonB
MKLTNVLSTAIIFLLPGAIAPAYSQGHEQEKQPEKQEAKPAQSKQEAKPAQAKQEAKPAQAKQEAKPAQAKQEAKPAQAKQEAKPAQAKQEAKLAQAKQEAKPAEARQAQTPQHAGNPQQANHAQAAAAHGRIPDDRFRASFGSGHTFHVNRSDFAGSSRRFQYGGFWFAMVNPWPVGWLYTDNVYIDYLNGGYFLCDPVHPGVFLSINIG